MEIFFNLLFSEVKLLCSVVLVSGVQQSDLVIPFHTVSPYRLLQNIEYSSLCYTEGPCRGLRQWPSSKEFTCNARNLQETQVRSLGQEDPLEESMATHSNILV